MPRGRKRLDQRQRIVISGSEQFGNGLKIKNFLYKLKLMTNNEIVIASLANTHGVDIYVKQYCNNLDIQYKEFPPYYLQWNPNCVMPFKMFNKDKQTFARSYYSRIYHAVKWCDYCFLFVTKNLNEKYIQTLVKNLKSKNKQFDVIDQS